MGGGALIQLAAYGTQNIYLTGDPQITYWKTVYKRYTNFSIESVEQNISGNILAGKKISVTISRDGDLLKNLFIQYNPQQIYNGNNVTFDNGGIPSNLGNTILKQMELEIGGNLIDRQYGIWLTIWNNITTINYITPSPPVDTYPTNYNNLSGTEPSVSTLSDRMTYNHQQQNTEFNLLLTTSGANSIPTSGTFTINLTSYVLSSVSSNNKILGGPGILIVTVSSVKYFIKFPSNPTVTLLNYVYTYSFANCICLNYPSTSVTIPLGTTVYFSYYNYNLSNAPTEAYVPMQFWFCKNPGLALPLIALQYHEVKFNIQLADYKELHATQFSDVNLTSFKVFADFVYLDSNERRLFAQNAHEYLIEQLQHNVFNNSFTSNISGGKLQINLNFANPVKEIVFCGYPDSVGIDSSGIATPTNLLTNSSVNLSNVQLGMVFNQVNRFSSRNLKYFTRNQIWDCHSGSGSANSSNAYDINDNIGVYSFSLRPEETQPSGSCNFSRIINPYLVFSNFATGEELNYVDIYATNYNILRIMSGMGNLAFAY